ncbi:unnamed protein product [Callosobruchus maculatus]|uniref:Uncharacterized protein n=1 Tax=Callosobruchus maculatus TaxID=64391 RepID=A0A653DF82_CALMS|nr:unnamed protein product [Callosobruchus maculatus]
MKLEQYFVIFSSLFTVGFAIKCFQCNSAEAPECADLRSNDTGSPFYKDCTGNYEGNEPFCRKIHTTVLYTETFRIVRSCGWIKEVNETIGDFCKKADTDFINQKTCLCFSDGCNSTFRIIPSSLLSITTVLISLCIFN